MYPILETTRLILKPLQDNDYENMFRIDSNPTVIETMEGEVQSDTKKYKKEFAYAVDSGDYLIIEQKETSNFIGYVAIHQYIKKSTISYSQIWIALLPEHWGHGLCTEATKALLQFAFTGIQTPLIYANQFCINPAAGIVLTKCGFSYYRSLKMKNEPYDQYRYFREDYLKDNSIDEEAEKLYDYSFAISKSPYSYDNPIRTIDKIHYIKEPTGYLCGQSVIAMLANISVDEVIEIMQTDQGTSVSMIDNALTYYGIKHTKTRKRFYEDLKLPDICILSLQLPGYGHWSLYFKGTFYDPEFGILDKLPPKAKLCYYWEIQN